MQTEKPILMTAENYRKCVSGEKTMTRRIINTPKWLQGILDRSNRILEKNDFHSVKCPYPVGTRLWVKEPFRICNFQFDNVDAIRVEYKHDGQSRDVHLSNREFDKFIMWESRTGGKSSLFMFKSLARLWLEVTAVRVERLQSISDKDVWAEGIDEDEYETWFEDVQNIAPPGSSFEQPKDLFRRLWDSINKDRAPWESNPWVFVYTFKKIEKRSQELPEDAE